MTENSHALSRSVNAFFGSGFLSPFGLTEIIIDHGYIGRELYALKRANPSVSPYFNYRTMTEYFRDTAIASDSGMYPDLRLVRTIADEPEQVKKAKELAEYIRPVETHLFPYNQDFGRPSFFGLYFSMNRPSHNMFTVFVTDDPTYFYVKSRLGNHAIVGPEAWHDKLNGTGYRFIKFSDFREEAKANQPYSSSGEWTPMTDDVNESA